MATIDYRDTFAADANYDGAAVSYNGRVIGTLAGVTTRPDGTVVGDVVVTDGADGWPEQQPMKITWTSPGATGTATTTLPSPFTITDNFPPPQTLEQVVAGMLGKMAERLAVAFSASAEEQALFLAFALGEEGAADVYADWLEDGGSHERASRVRARRDHAGEV